MRRAVAVLLSSALVAAALSVVALVSAPAAQAVINYTACTISGPLSPLLAPPPDNPKLDIDPAFVQFQATDGHGNYAGISHLNNQSGGVFRVIRRSAATGRITILDSFAYLGHSYEPARGTVRVVGFDRWGGIVVAVQRTNTDWEDQRFVAIRYDQAGHKVPLQFGSQWSSAMPVGIDAIGTVLGVMRSGPINHRLERVVAWTGPGAGHSRILTPPGHTARGIASNGDWYEQTAAPSSTTYVHLARNHSVHALISYNNEPLWNTSLFVVGVSGNSAFGLVQTPSNVNAGSRWVPGAPAAGAKILPHKLGYLVWISAVGLNNDVVGEYPGNGWPEQGTRVLVTATGKAYRLPPQFHSPHDDEPRPVVDPYGGVVYTGTDRLPHLIRCPR